MMILYFEFQQSAERKVRSKVHKEYSYCLEQIQEEAAL